MFVLFVPDEDIDGMNMWGAISTGSASPRSEFIYNFDDMFPPLQGHAGIRYEISSRRRTVDVFADDADML